MNTLPITDLEGVKTPSYIDYHIDYDTVRKSLFLGDKVGLIENLRNEFPQVWDLYKLLKSLDWNENEIDISSCRNEFKHLDKEISDLMIKTLAWQFEADSSAAQVGTLVIPFVNNTELLCFLYEHMKNECLTGDHEVLTDKGWIRIDTVTKSDKVAQWSHKDNSVSFVLPKDVITIDYSGDMYVFSNAEKSIDQITTPKHRIPFFSKHGLSGSDKWQYASEIILDNEIKIPTSGVISGKTQMTVYEKICTIINTVATLSPEKTEYTITKCTSKTVDQLRELCRLDMWNMTTVYVTETNEYSVKLTIPNYRNVDEIQNTTWVKYESLSYIWLQEFISIVNLWSKNYNAEEGIAGFIFNNNKFLELVITALHLVGLRTTINNIGNDTCTLNITNNGAILGSDIQKTTINHNGKVYCLTVPNGYFLVKRNNVISVTGNCLHSLAYKVIVEYSFDNPNDFIKELLSIKESFSRLDTVKKVFNDMFILGNQYNLNMVNDKNTITKMIFKFWVTMLALERIQFMSSFAITFGLAEQNYFVPIAKLVQKICTDEYQVHVQADKVILSNEFDIVENFAIYLEIIDEVGGIVNEIVNSELTWLDFLFNGKEEISGIRKSKIKEFVIYSATEVYKFLNIKNPYGDIYINPLPYMNKWIVIDDNQPSPQEESVGNYLLGGFVDDSGTMPSIALDF